MAIVLLRQLHEPEFRDWSSLSKWQR